MNSSYLPLPAYRLAYALDEERVGRLRLRRSYRLRRAWSGAGTVPRNRQTKRAAQPSDGGRVDGRAL